MPEGIRTPDPRLRRPLLYPAELLTHALFIREAGDGNRTKEAKPAKKEPVKPEIIVQYQNSEVDTAAVEERVKAQFVAEGHKAGFIRKLNIYIKPEEYSAYYVINDKFSGRVDLF